MIDNGELLHRAIRIAADVHHGQDRKYTGLPYITHPLSVMMRVRAVSDNQVMLAAAVLHDVLEDGSDPTGIANRILNHCGKEVLELVQQLTDQYTNKNYPNLNRAERKAAECAAWQQKSVQARTIKLADIIDNTESIETLDGEFAALYLAEKRRLLTSLHGGDDTLLRQARCILGCS